MQRFARLVLRFIKFEDGPTAVEYALMMALIVVVCVSSISTLGSHDAKTYKKVAKAVKVAGP